MTKLLPDSVWNVNRLLKLPLLVRSFSYVQTIIIGTVKDATNGDVLA